MKKAAPFLILLAGMLWGSMGLFVRTLNGRGLASMGIVSLRAIITAVSMLIFLLIFDRRYLRIKRSHPCQWLRCCCTPHLP